MLKIEMKTYHNLVSTAISFYLLRSDSDYSVVGQLASTAKHPTLVGQLASTIAPSFSSISKAFSAHGYPMLPWHHLLPTTGPIVISDPSLLQQHLRKGWSHLPRGSSTPGRFGDKILVFPCLQSRLATSPCCLR